ncbi:hypothetical protein XarbCFBP7604_09840 [Xanthomonas arboricola]|uniref:hypothetical protein n=1 Tax=Xanthomonas arboricola TaxID=56448 RepID=UPI000CEE7908|nr:hypothetical protein [Xanthomonas arboricola]PPU34139.1 hypothetical protein XarbCFBP7604_09840 [Xanthomonas arboricola]
MKAYPARVREWLKANPGAHSPRVILDGMRIAQGAENRRPYYSAIKDNADGGYLKRVGNGPRPAYEFVCDPPPHEGESLSRVEKHRAYMRQRHLDKGGRTLAERRIDEAFRKSARLERLEAEKQERALAREQRKAANGRRRLAADARVVRKAKATARAVIAVRSVPAAMRKATPTRTPVQSVEEFIRAGGQVTRLPGVEQYIPDRCRA